MSLPFTQLLANSLIIGSIYALVASGFSLIYSANRFMHFAHGISVVASGYALYTLFSVLGLGFWASATLTIALAAVLGVGMQKLLYQPLKHNNASSVVLLLASLGLAPKLIQELFEMIQGLVEDGISVLLVEQNAKQAIQAADRTYLLEQGRVALSGGEEIAEHEKIQQVYLGGDVDE